MRLVDGDEIVRQLTEYRAELIRITAVKPVTGLKWRGIDDLVSYRKGIADAMEYIENAEDIRLEDLAALSNLDNRDS